MALEILTSDGFKLFDGVGSKGIKKCLKLTFSDTTYIVVSENHALELTTGYALARELVAGDEFSTGKILSTIEEAGDVETFDIINVHGAWSYIGNGVVNHNCAFVDGYDEFFASVYPTISSGTETKLLMTSTPNGLNHFFKICEGAKQGTNGYQYVEVTWDLVPGRGEAWKQETLEALNFDQEKFSQEYECQFLGSSGTLIDGATLKYLQTSYREPLHEAQGLAVYERPEKGRTYVCIADVSRGKGLDYSAFHIIDVTQMPYKQVVTYRNNFVTPVDYADIIFRTTKSYNDAYILIEINDIGGQVSDTLHFDFEVETLLYTESAGRSGKRISGGFGSNVDKGIRTTKQVKSVGCSVLKLLAEQKQLQIVDFNTINELSTFSRKGASYEAESGCHDDLVMGLVLFAWLTTQAFFKEITDINTMMKLREKSDEQLMDELLPFGLTYDDIEPVEPIYTPTRSGWMNDW